MGVYMRRIAIIVAGASIAVLSAAPVVADPTVSIGGASATAVGAWVKPTGCSQFPVDYFGLPAGAYVRIHVLDAVTRADAGSSLLTSSDPRSGRVNIQVCNFQVEDTTSLLLSLDVTGVGVADSAIFAFVPRPNTVRCVNKKTYTIKEFQGKKCPAGWVHR